MRSAPLGFPAGGDRRRRWADVLSFDSFCADVVVMFQRAVCQ